MEDVPKRIAMGGLAQSGSRAILTATAILAPNMGPGQKEGKQGMGWDGMYDLVWMAKGVDLLRVVHKQGTSLVGFQLWGVGRRGKRSK
jgi:hypothetical protein